MTVSDLIKKTGWQPLTEISKAPVRYAYVCDLLSLAMANMRPGTVWITVQSHLNVVAVASLAGCCCVVIPENIEVSEETLHAAHTKGVCILSAGCSAYGASCMLSRLGMGEVPK
jgi:hypothetical protein